MTIFKMACACLMIGGIALAADVPNVVFIYGDDVGYADVGAYGSTLIPTPNIDRLAAEGLRFTDGHCGAATCTPSRFSLLTGLHGFRKNVRILPPGATMVIPTDVLTLPKVFKQAGYKTGVVGKWHLGLGKAGVPVDWNGEVKPGPLEVGFDYSFLLPSTNDRVPCVYLENYRVVNLDPKDPLYLRHLPEGVTATRYPDARKTPEAMTYYKSSHGHNHSVINGIGRIGTMFGGKAALWNDETMADEFVKQAVAFIDRNKAAPFFLYFSSQDVHVPRVPHPRFHGKTKLGYRGDAMVQFDWSTGEIMKALDEHGLAENTIVVFSSDNGPVYDDGYQDGTVVKPRKGDSDGGHDASGVFRGGKYQIYEGGTRVPFIIRWPKRIKPGVSSALVSQLDFVASFASLLKVTLHADDAADSRNMMNAFLGKTDVGLPYMLEEARQLAVRRGEWKYVAPTSKKAVGGELYNLGDDVGEQKNVLQAFPEIAKEMSELLEALRVSAGVRAYSER